MFLNTYNLNMNNIESVFAKNIRRLRNERHLSQADVAEALGITLVAYQNYEREERRPKKEIIPKIASFFNVSVDELYKDETQPKPKTFAETLPVGRLIELMGKKTKNIPDWVFEMAELINDKDHQAWKDIKSILEHHADSSSSSSDSVSIKRK